MFFEVLQAGRLRGDFHESSSPKEDFISLLANNQDITLEEAENILFPVETRSTQPPTKASYGVVRVSWTGRLISEYFDSRQVYFYCETTESGWFRAIRRIVYAGFNSGNKLFKGSLQYALPDPNRIHYTLNGDLYNRGTLSIGGGGSIGVGGIATINFNVSYARDFYQHIFRDKNVTF